MQDFLLQSATVSTVIQQRFQLETTLYRYIYVRNQIPVFEVSFRCQLRRVCQKSVRMKRDAQGLFPGDLTLGERERHDGLIQGWCFEPRKEGLLWQQCHSWYQVTSGPVTTWSKRGEGFHQDWTVCGENSAHATVWSLKRLWWLGHKVHCAKWQISHKASLPILTLELHNFVNLGNIFQFLWTLVSSSEKWG